MSQLKVLEHYTSVQGEGLYTGKLTQFVRFAGCNLRCPGWPCDTKHAIEPSLFIGKYNNQSPEMLSESIQLEARRNGAINVCFTGGEPLMQPNDLIYETMRMLGKDFEFEFFTNGTYIIPPWIYKDHQVTMDWKLPGSGEELKNDAIKNRFENARRLQRYHALKFVCKDSEDLEMAVAAGEFLRDDGVVATYWLGAAFGELSEADVVEFMKRRKLTEWKLNVQVHKYVWSPEKQGV